MAHTEQQIFQKYELAKMQYANFGVDVERALLKLGMLEISLHCWQGDDVAGFEDRDFGLSGGIAATGNYPGKARSVDELRRDLDLVYRLLPGKHRLNLHAIYLESDKKIPRDEILPEHFRGWVDWAKENQHGLDFNPTCFSHPKADSGFTLSSPDQGIRQFWVDHCIACRKIGESFGRELGKPAITNIWIPDGYKDTPFDRVSPRKRLVDSLDRVLAENIDKRYNLDAVEPKLFGIGSESYVTGSMEFYLGYAITRGILLTLDSGHFHPTKSVSDKISSLFLYLDALLLHVSRGVRWDSDHVVTYDDALQSIAQEVVRQEAFDRTYIGFDYFDASINRVAAWTIGARNTLKAFLAALLEPKSMLAQAEKEGDFTKRLALMENQKWMPLSDIWDYYCLKNDVPYGMDYLKVVKEYERGVLFKRQQ
jgi:L-rhamnose isomerase